MQILMDVTINWMGQLNPEYTLNIVNVLKSMPERIKAGAMKVREAKPENNPGPNITEEERSYTYANIEGVNIDWTLFKDRER